jgi:heme-degrading monooxygenase HmoA
MVLEIADLSIIPGKNAEFEVAIEAGVREVISKAKGFIRYKVQKGVENPNRYLLMIEWETLHHHMVDFRESPRVCHLA